MIDRTYLLLAELESEAAGKISVLEERVAAFKECEDLVYKQYQKKVNQRIDARYQQNLIRFRRFGAEADVLALKDLSAVPAATAGSPAPKATPPTPPEASRGGVQSPVNPRKPRPFPTDETVYPLLAAKLVAPTPADASPLRKAHHAQLREVGEFLEAARAQINSGRYAFGEYDSVFDLIDRMYRILVELEPRSAGKVAILEERVTVIKEYERMMTDRVNEGREPPPQKNLIQFRRLGAEADLIMLKDQSAKTGEK
jgi:hypothetical protein